MPENFECAIIGGGPAGLTAAVYLARFHRSVVLFDAGGGRAASIPRSHNVPGYPEGVTGPELLAAMAKHARHYGADLRSGAVETLEPVGKAWRLRGEGIDVAARAVLIATGVENLHPDIPAAVHAAALAAGQLRYCPVCDGHEAAGPERTVRIGVLGAKSHGVAEALFLRHFTPNVTLFTHETCELHEKDRAELARTGTGWDPRPVTRYDFGGKGVTLHFADGEAARIDTLYSALGTRPHTALVAQLGLVLDDEDCVLADRHQRLGLRGLYGAGDVVAALDQIAVAMGHAAVAATAMHNDLRDADGETLD